MSCIILFVFHRRKYYFTSMPFENITVLLWISNFRQNWKKRNFLWAIRWRRRSFSWAAHNGFYHALIPLYCSQALLMWSDKGIKKPSICFTAHFELIPSVWLELGGATCASGQARRYVSHWSGLRIFQQKLFDGKIASKWFKFEWFGIFKASEGQENWKKGQKIFWRPNKGQRSKNPIFHNFWTF